MPYLANFEGFNEKKRTFGLDLTQAFLPALREKLKAAKNEKWKQ